jgi:uncharacterized protein YbjT (DUF2867 family)
MKYPRVLVIGGSGFIGSQLVAKLATSGRSVLVPSRHRERARHLIVLPTVEVMQADVYQTGQLKALAARVDAVVNLVGVLHGKPGVPYGKEFANAHVELTRRIADACIGSHAKRLIHVSALGVREGREHSMPSMYLRSKAAGEQVLRQRNGLELTILRPSVVFGPGDRFLNLFARLLHWLPVLPLARADSKLQPVYCDDVAQAIVNALDNQATVGKTYELVGPDVYSLRELVTMTGQWSGHRRPVIALPDALGRLQALMLEFAPGRTLMSRDNFDSLKANSIAATPAGPGLKELGITATPLSAVAPSYLGPALDPMSVVRARALR